MAESRWTSHPTIVPDCPVCLQPLPPVVVDVDARAEGSSTSGRVLSLDMTLQELDAAWWDAAEVLHPTCGIRSAQQSYLAHLS